MVTQTEFAGDILFLACFLEGAPHQVEISQHRLTASFTFQERSEALVQAPGAAIDTALDPKRCQAGGARVICKLLVQFAIDLALAFGAVEGLGRFGESPTLCVGRTAKSSEQFSRFLELGTRTRKFYRAGNSLMVVGASTQSL